MVSVPAAFEGLKLFLATCAELLPEPVATERVEVSKGSRSTLFEWLRRSRFAVSKFSVPCAC